jgi:hypothetical protein
MRPAGNDQRCDMHLLGFQVIQDKDRADEMGW